MSDRFEVKSVAGVVVRRNRFRITVHHDRFEAGVPKREDRMNTAIIEFDALTDSVRSAAEDDDLASIGWPRLTLVFVGRIEVRRMRLEFRAASVDSLVDGMDAQAPSLLANLGFGHAPECGDSRIRESQLFRGPEPLFSFLGRRGDQSSLGRRDLFEIAQEPAIDLRPFEDFIDAGPTSKSFDDRPGATRLRRIDLGPERRLAGLSVGQFRRLESSMTDLERSDRLLKALLESTPDGHDFADRLHLRRQRRIGGGEFLEGESWNLRHDIIDRRLEARRRFARNVVGNFIERVAHRQLRGDLGDRETGRLRSQSRRAGNAWVHLDHDERSVLRIHAELHIRPTGIDTDLAHDGDGSVTHLLIFTVGQGLRRRHRDRISGMDTHRIKILDRADHDDVVSAIPHDLEFVLLPAHDALFDEALRRRRLIERPLRHSIEILVSLADPAPRAPHRKARPNDRRELRSLQNLPGLTDRGRDTGCRHAETNAIHRIAEQLSILCLVDRLEVRTDESDAVPFEYARLGQIDREVEGGLAPDRGQQRVRALRLDDQFDALDRHRFDVGPIRRLRIGHDRRRVRIHEDDAVALFTQCLASLGSRVVELASLTDHDRSRANHENGMNVVSSRH